MISLPTGTKIFNWLCTLFLHYSHTVLLVAIIATLYYLDYCNEAECILCTSPFTGRFTNVATDRLAISNGDKVYVYSFTSYHDRCEFIKKVVNSRKVTFIQIVPNSKELPLPSSCNKITIPNSSYILYSFGHESILTDSSLKIINTIEAQDALILKLQHELEISSQYDIRNSKVASKLQIQYGRLMSHIATLQLQLLTCRSLLRKASQLLYLICNNHLTK